jgi:serine/threonine-protein kinase
MKIGRYEILDEIGHGAMGRVYRARDPLIDRTVAIKTVSIDLLQQEGAGAEARFLREAQSAGRLSHPNIVTIYDVGEANGLAYIAMEYLSGATLRDLMDLGPMPLDLALETATQMAEALAFAHAHGVIHRDIKPANVVVSEQQGRVKLSDFGIAHLVNSNHTQTGQMLGSPRYMSPEQAMGKEINGRSDIFSLGAVLYEMLTGRYAFDGDNLPVIVYRLINETPVDASTLRGLPGELNALLTRLLSKNPENRPDAAALLQDLRALQHGDPQAPAPAPSNRVPRMLPILAFATPLGVFLLIGIGFIVIQHFLESTTQAPTPTTATAASPLQLPSTSTTAEIKTEPPVAVQPSPKPNGARQRSQPAADPYLAGLDSKQVELRILRTELLLKYTEQHPDVMQIDRQLDQLRSERRAYLQKQRRN